MKQLKLITLLEASEDECKALEESLATDPNSLRVIDKEIYSMLLDVDEPGALCTPDCPDLPKFTKRVAEAIETGKTIVVPFMVSWAPLADTKPKPSKGPTTDFDRMLLRYYKGEIPLEDICKVLLAKESTEVLPPMDNTEFLEIQRQVQASNATLGVNRWMVTPCTNQDPDGATHYVILWNLDLGPCVARLAFKGPISHAKEHLQRVMHSWKPTPDYYFALLNAPARAVNGPTFQFVLKEFFDEHKRLDDREETEAGFHLNHQWTRIDGSTYSFNGTVAEAFKYLTNLTWESPLDFELFVAKGRTPTYTMGVDWSKDVVEVVRGLGIRLVPDDLLDIQETVVEDINEAIRKGGTLLIVNPKVYMRLRGEAIERFTERDKLKLGLVGTMCQGHVLVMVHRAVIGKGWEVL